MNVRIMSLDEVQDSLVNKEFVDNVNLVSIRHSWKNQLHDDIDRAIPDERLIKAVFDDVEEERTGYQMAVREDVERILKWTDGRDDVCVHCFAGVSRSTAVAYLIKCKYDGINRALEILDRKNHCPNMHIVKLGAEIMKNGLIYDMMGEWDGERKDIFARRWGI